MDNSNVYIGGQDTARSKGEDSFALRIFFSSFLYLITEGTNDFDEIVWGGSIPPESDEVWKKIRSKGIEPELIPRADSGENETVDHAIQLSMYRHGRKYRKSPGTIVLCTGDGSGYFDDKGFLFDVKGFVEDGWDLVLYSWDGACHKQLKKLAQEHGKYVSLDEHYNSITFIKNGRKAELVKL
ncbi:MAG: NYN domain-containing protein [Hymenobacter sp.]|nr:MAG: NYN domain-containing protein [Hymenobacter sp.]